ncbi:MAG TPA: M15 family metallopeptidase [Candidatus Saccharimonadales bacterium]|nr:M15 family metallopeptidase [Candidatus Saccharimonadales bacterium]
MNHKKLYHIKRLSFWAGIAVYICMLVWPSTAFARTLSVGEEAQLNDTPFFDPTFGCTNFNSTGSGPGNVSGSAAQDDNAKTIIGIAKTDGLGENAAQIGLMVGLDESTLLSLANQNVPLSEHNPNKQGDGSSGTSLGVFQQQITFNWSTISSNINDVAAINQLMTPAYAAEAFFGSPPGSGAPSALSKGLQNVTGWQSMQPWVAAQAVQHSGTPDGSNYEREVANARSYLNKFWSSAPAVALPVAIHQGGGTGNGNGGGQGGSNCSSGVTVPGNCTVTSPVYLPQYSVAQLVKIFGNYGTASSHPDLHLVNVTLWGFTTQVSPLVAPCLEATVQQIQAEHINYKVYQFGCYRFDSNNGSSNIGVASYHTYGAACDINWSIPPPGNPFIGSGAPAAHTMPDAYVKAFYDHGFTWGGSWTSPKDYMHFEWHGVVPK